MEQGIVYEQPLTERVRTFLRLAHLFRLNEHNISGTTEWDIRSSLEALLNITELVSRTDIKSELAKELDRHATTLKSLREKPGVDLERLDIILQDINKYLEILRDKECQPGQMLRQDELVSSVRQRNTISGGTCSFDLPSYHFWLNKPADELRQTLNAWQDDLRIIKKSIYLVINLIRNSSHPSTEIAEKGFFQKSLEQHSGCQLIRVILPKDSPCYPEISAGKHRFTVRFMQLNDTAARPVQIENDQEFRLHCCIL